MKVNAPCDKNDKDFSTNERGKGPGEATWVTGSERSQDCTLEVSEPGKAASQGWFPGHLPQALGDKGVILRSSFPPSGFKPPKGFPFSTQCQLPEGPLCPTSPVGKRRVKKGVPMAFLEETQSDRVARKITY